MIRLAANLSYLFVELSFLDRFAAAADVGFRAVEWNFAYDVPQSALAQHLGKNRLKLALFNTPAGDMEGGELGLAALPEREADAAAAFEQALDRAVVLGAPLIHYLAGNLPAGQDSAAADALFLQNMMYAADRAAEHGVTITLEPLNPRDRPHYHLVSVEHAMRLIETAARPNIGLQLDLYHCQMTEEHLNRTIDRYVDAIVHVQVASSPQRAEPLTKEIALLDRLDALGYAGFVGCEYVPARGTRDGLGWALPYLAAERTSSDLISKA